MNDESQVQAETTRGGEQPGRGMNGGRSATELRGDIERHRDNLDRTLSALERKFSPGELLDEGLSYMKSGPGEFVANLARTARSNPVPMVLTGVGLAWLMLGDRDAQPKHAQREGTGGKAADDRLELGALYAAELEQEYPFAADEVECILFDDLGAEAAAYARDRQAGGTGAGEKLKQAGESVSSGAAELQQQMHDRMEQVRERMGAAAADVQERAGRARERAWRQARRGQAAAMRGGRAAAHRAGEWIERYPLSLVALGVAAGAALGTTIPETRREDQLMGDASDRLKERARDEFDSGKDRAGRALGAARAAAVAEAEAEGLTAHGLRERGAELGDSAEKVMDAARSEAERQNLSAEAARDEIQDMEEKLGRVAEAAREAAEEEGRKR